MAASIQLSAADQPAWYQFVTDFDANYALFQTNYNALINLKIYIYTKHPELKSQYDALIADGAKQAATLNTLRTVRDSVDDWIGGVESSVGKAYQGAVDWTSNLFSQFLHDAETGLGFVPVIMGVAAATTALAAIAYWVNDAYQFSQKLNALQKLESQGYSAQDAANILNKTLGTSNGGIVNNLIVLAAVVGLLWFVVPKLLAGRK